MPNIVTNPTVLYTIINMNSMTNEQWNTVIDAVNDKYPDSDCLEILINNVPYFPTFLINNSL